MEFWGSLASIAVLMVIHLTVWRWPILQGKHRLTWLSISAGTALAYVFAYLMPKLALIQVELSTGWLADYPFVRNHSYLIALAGLLTFFAIGRTVDRHANDAATTLIVDRILITQLLGYGIYSAQIGSLIADLSEPGFVSYALVTTVLGLHIMGIDYHLFRANPVAYQRVLRLGFAVAMLAGWGIGAYTDGLKPAVMISSTFVAGGIIINAIRDELPQNAGQKHTVFFVAVALATTAILLVQHLQS